MQMAPLYFYRNNYQTTSDIRNKEGKWLAKIKLIIIKCKGKQIYDLSY